jgi:hypothetical protein
LTWTAPNNQPVTSLAKPVTDCMTYTSGDVTAAGGDPANLVIGFAQGGVSGPWTLVKPKVDAANSRVCADQSQVFYFQALFTPQPGLPTTGGQLPTSNWWWVIVLAGLGLTLVRRGARTLHR